MCLNDKQLCLAAAVALVSAEQESPVPPSQESSEEPPEGYYAFVEAPSAQPPKVRPPPYTHVSVDCKDYVNKKPFVSVHNICGDLNKGQIPRNPMQQSINGEPYPL